MIQQKLDSLRVGRIRLIKYKYGRIRGVKFKQTKKLRWMDYEAY